jgi:AbrB family looped-hinge helix DNA binding protein
MRFEVTLTARGQITLPKKFRESFGLEPGSKIAFSQLSDGTVVVRIKHRKASDLAGILTRDDQPAVSIEEMRR